MPINNARDARTLSDAARGNTTPSPAVAAIVARTLARIDARLAAQPTERTVGSGKDRRTVVAHGGVRHNAARQVGCMPNPFTGLYGDGEEQPAQTEWWEAMRQLEGLGFEFRTIYDGEQWVSAIVWADAIGGGR
jgi:hypothetical protein